VKRRTRGAGQVLVGSVVLLALGAGCTPATPATVPVPSDHARREATAEAGIDGTTLADRGLEWPEGANVFAARIFGGDTPAYAFYEAGGGGFSNAFFPASAIKLLAALGALDFARSLGFTGDAIVDGAYSLRDLYDAALRDSSNEAYDELVRVAGLERLNREFLVAQGYPSTTIQEPYGGGDEQVGDSPEMVLTDADHTVVVPERDATASDYGCGGGNCTNLFELADAVRRVVLDAELPAGERFDLSPSDIAGLQDALAGADGFIAPGVYDALGPQARIFTKPGWVPGLDCVESALVIDPATGHRFLIALSAPDDGTCEELATMARAVLRILDT